MALSHWLSVEKTGLHSKHLGGFIFLAFFVLIVKECFVGHVSADICVFGGTNFPTSQILSWANLAQCPQSGGTESGVAKNQREAGAHLMVASPQAADYCISLFSTNHIGCDTEIQRYESQTTRLSPTIGPFP